MLQIVHQLNLTVIRTVRQTLLVILHVHQDLTLTLEITPVKHYVRDKILNLHYILIVESVLVFAQVINTQITIQALAQQAVRGSQDITILWIIPLDGPDVS